jgi:RimJ/RimL family protein N-acetyltransferase
MKIGIQRRSLCLTPIAWDEREWLYEALDDPEIFGWFGFSSPAGDSIRRRHENGNLVVGIMRRTGAFAPIGFVMLFPPTDEFCRWELSYVVTERSRRNAFFAIHASDAIFHYMFDHLNADEVGWRTRADNRPALAILRRLGYATTQGPQSDGHTYVFSRLDREAWAQRLERLGPDPFVVFDTSPFQPP